MRQYVGVSEEAVSFAHVQQFHRGVPGPLPTSSAASTAPDPAGLTARQVVDFLVSTSPQHAIAFADITKLRVAVNHEFVDWDSPVSVDAELAFLPPITGG